MAGDSRTAPGFPPTPTGLFCLTAGHAQVTQQALGGVPVRHPAGVETCPVRVHSPADCRVTGQAVALGVTCGAALQSLSRGSAVLEQPLRLRVMERHVQPTAASESCVGLTAAE